MVYTDTCIKGRIPQLLYYTTDHQGLDPIYPNLLLYPRWNLHFTLLVFGNTAAPVKYRPIPARTGTPYTLGSSFVYY